MVCINNKSEKKELVIGNTYNVLEGDIDTTYWVVINEQTHKTIQCYKSDFISQSDLRDNKIKEILK